MLEGEPAVSSASRTRRGAPAPPKRPRTHTGARSTGRAAAEPPERRPSLPSAARAGFNAAALRILRRRFPDLTWRVITDDQPDALSDAPPTAGHNDGLQSSAR